MKRGGLILSIAGALLCATVSAQQAPPQEPGGRGNRGGGAQAPSPNAPRVYIRAGLKTHGAGQHDYPQFLADWSKILTDRYAAVDGSLHFPKAEELANVDVIVMYKGDAGAMTPE